MNDTVFPFSVFGRKTGSVSSRVIYTELLKIIIPAGIELILIQTVSMFDQIQVGSIGKYATNAVGLVTQIRMLFNTIFISINIGVTVLVARAQGREDGQEVKRILQHGLVLILTISLLSTAIVMLFPGLLFHIIGFPDETSRAYALAYLRICVLTFVPAAISSTITAALRGMGNTVIPCVYNTIANVCNIFLNWVLINGNLGFPRLGVEGAAIATVVSILLGFFISLGILLSDRFGLRICLVRSFNDLEIDCLKYILRIGLPSLLEQMIVRTGLILFTRIVATLGTDMYAAHMICLNIQMLTYMNGMAFSVASTTKMGQCLGAENEEMAALYCQYCARMCCALSSLLTIAYFFYGRSLIMLYNRDSVVIAMGIIPLKIMAFQQPLSALQYVFFGALRGAGDVKHTAKITAITTFLIRPTIAFLLVRYTSLGLVGAWIAMVADQSISTMLLCLRFCSGKWRYVFVEQNRLPLS